MSASMIDARSRWIVSTDWLAGHLDAPDVVIVDASWYLPTSGRDAAAEYRVEHIPGAVFFDIDAIADTTSSLPHMLPRPEAFSSTMRKMGIGDGQRIVVYDAVGMFSAARVWWTFRLMGVEDVVVLDGGLAAWRAEERPLTDDIPDRPERHFTARFDHGAVRDFAEVRHALAGNTAQVVDLRPQARFNGTEPEPREGLPSGHMPGGISLPMAELLVADGSRMKEADGIRAALTGAGIDLHRPIVSSCGSGVNGAVLNLALEVIGHPHHALFDGSWTEWASAGGEIEDKGPVRGAA
ncbi:thiosulfate/3-mercaptopyruvate sulfurtransferase [Rhodobium orientis]|nr:3-mercaptopyruvate sulfurtransferase [Rhodobium orientis]MBB4301474.1 thiosulfate/3-mercaptopyruvate sulfurtransferase [Rhodobium orientis]